MQARITRHLGAADLIFSAGASGSGPPTMSEQAPLAKRTAIYAFYSRSQLLIIAEGLLPTPDWELDIGQTGEESAPIFEIRARRRPGAGEGEATQFRYGEIFTIGRPAEHVVVRHSEGQDNVPVEFTEEDLVDIVLSLSLEDSHDVEIGGLEDDLELVAATEPPAAPAKPAAAPPLTPPAPRPAASPVLSAAPATPPPARPSPILSDIGVRYREAVGYSNKLSFDEALADALKRLPPPAVKFPDMLETVEVVHIGGAFGGIAGFHRLEIRVRAYPD